jgi:excisionase family DNA binding protein
MPKRSQTFKPNVRAEEDSEAGLGDKSDVAKLCKVSVRTVEEWVKARRIPFIRMGHRLLRFDLVAVKQAVARWTTTEIR